MSYTAARSTNATKIRLCSHRIPSIPNELEGMTRSQPRSPRLRFPFLFELTKNVHTNTHHPKHAPPDRKTSTTRSARRLVAHRAVDDEPLVEKKDACMTLLRRTTSLAGAGVFMTVDRARPWDGYSLCPELYAISRHPGAWKGCAFVVSTVREDLHSRRLPGDATSDPSTATPSR